MIFMDWEGLEYYLSRMSHPIVLITPRILLLFELPPLTCWYCSVARTALSKLELQIFSLCYLSILLGLVYGKEWGNRHWEGSGNGNKCGNWRESNGS